MEQLAAQVESFPNQSIYEGKRLAQPDEVWNFRRGDGIEKALLLFDILKYRNPGLQGQLEIKGADVELSVRENGKNPAVWRFVSEKQLEKSLSL